MKLTRNAGLSRALAAHVFAMFWILASAVQAHEVRPSVADVTVSADRIELYVRLSAEGMLAGINLSEVDDTDNAPEAAEYDALRLLSPEDLTARFEAAWPSLAEGMRVDAGGGPITVQLVGTEFAPVGDPELPRDAAVTLSGALPAGGSAVTVGWVAAYGPLVVRQGDSETGYSGYLTNGALSAPLPREGVAREGAIDAFLDYIVIGFEHIIPKGLDHILFVLGLFFFSLAMRPLIMQVTAFTLAHTVTLAMASLGWVTISASIVEPLIAASIVYVAVENVVRPKLGWWRTAIVFGFGLLHGLGFASVLGDIGLDPTRFISGLIAFNIGVELGQLAVIAAAFLLVGLWFGKKPWYRARIAVPASIAIALVGAYWFVERVFL